MPRHTQPALDSNLLLQMPKLGVGKDPSCSWVSEIWEECGWRRKRAQCPRQRGHSLSPHKGFLFRSWERLVTSDWFLAELHPIRRKHGEGHLPKWE